MIDLFDSIALISGGSRGIGAATAEAMASAGANIALIYQKNEKMAIRVSEIVRSFGRECLILNGNVEREIDCRRILRKVLKRFSRVDILVNSAGIWEYGKIGNMSSRAWKRSIDVNLTGTFNMCNACVPFMKKRKSGAIINVSSTAGQRGEAFHSQYAASKGGVIAFTKSLGTELAPFGIRVNCVAPGWVDTDMTHNVLTARASRRQILDTIPRGVPATAEEIAGPIVFLASPLASNIIGEVLNVNGGSVLCG